MSIINGDSHLICYLGYKLLILSSGSHDCENFGSHAWYGRDVVHGICWVTVGIKDPQMPWEIIRWVIRHYSVPFKCLL